MVATIVFNLFLFGAFTIFSAGLKNYRLIDTKSDAQVQAEVAMGRILSDLKSTDITSMATGSVDEEYLVFETAWTDPAVADHRFAKDNGYPMWQGYILYYTYPRGPGAEGKKLLRKFVPHNPSSLAVQMTDISLYLTDSFNAGEELRVVARDIYDMEITKGGNNYTVDISLVTFKSFSEKRLAYTRDFSDDAGREFVTLKSSVTPRNTP